VFVGVKFCEVLVKAITAQNIAFTLFLYQELAFSFFSV
jgi:hypothetical protein